VTKPTAAEIEAAARAVYDGHGWGLFWEATTEERREQYRQAAREGFVAALPQVEARLREQIAAEIEAAEVAGLEPGPGGLGPAARWGLGLAARIVRGA
jgi:hypothetical protein